MRPDAVLLGRAARPGASSTGEDVLGCASTGYSSGVTSAAAAQPRFDGSAQQLRCWVPAAQCASALGDFLRWGGRDRYDKLKSVLELHESRVSQIIARRPGSGECSGFALDDDWELEARSPVIPSNT